MGLDMSQSSAESSLVSGGYASQDDNYVGNKISVGRGGAYMRVRPEEEAISFPDFIPSRIGHTLMDCKFDLPFTTSLRLVSLSLN